MCKIAQSRFLRSTLKTSLVASREDPKCPLRVRIVYIIQEQPASSKVIGYVELEMRSFLITGTEDLFSSLRIILSVAQYSRPFDD